MMLSLYNVMLYVHRNGLYFKLNCVIKGQFQENDDFMVIFL